MDTNKLAMTVAEFARAAAISKSTAYNLIREGKVLARKSKRRTLILIEDAQQWLRDLPFK